MVFARVVPGSVRGVVALVPGLLLAASLVAGLAALLWRSLHSYDSFLAVQGDLSVTQYGSLISDPQFHTVLARSLTMAVIAPAVAIAIAIPYALTLTRIRTGWRCSSGCSCR